jgi:hypothetical protein
LKQLLVEVVTLAALRGIEPPIATHTSGTKRP